MEGRRGRAPNSERQSRGGSEVSGSRRRKGRPPNLGESEFPSPSEAKLLRKLEAQGKVILFDLFTSFIDNNACIDGRDLSVFLTEIARQAAQMKLMRKLEKQALARAAKEARKQQGTPGLWIPLYYSQWRSDISLKPRSISHSAIMAAEERRKQKEQLKILKQQVSLRKKPAFGQSEGHLVWDYKR